MPLLRSSVATLDGLRYSQLSRRYAFLYGQTFSRSCSDHAPRSLKSSPKKKTLDTTTNPPTPPADHRVLAQSQNLFTTSPYSPGSPLLQPNGTNIFQKLQTFLRAQYPSFGFQEVVTPTIYKKSLWQVSGHWDSYAKDMFSVTGRGATGETADAQAGQDEEFGLKPMNCPGHCLLFGSAIRSYRDLPIRYADFSALHRNEISGSLSGLTRVRRFHQDDGHIFCRPDQIQEEILQTLDFVSMVYETLGLGPYRFLLSTRPEEHIGTVEEWDAAESQLKAAIESRDLDWELNEGDGAFYGPKIDIMLKDSDGKEHQTATVQLDFQLPQRFDLQYQASPEELRAQKTPQKGVSEGNLRPVIIHRAIYGSLERFMALLIEHYNGVYPFWVSPRQAIILSLNSEPETLRHVAKLQKLLSTGSDCAPEDKKQRLPLDNIHLNIDTDISSRPLGKKKQEAREKKYNHIIVVGGKEAANDAMQIDIASQPHKEDAEKLLAEHAGIEDMKKERHLIVNVTVGRKYMVDLVRRYL